MATNRKVSEKFRCPHCAALLTKSPMAVILGSAGGFIGLCERPPQVTCPSCIRPIDPMAMIRGEYDVHEPSGFATLAILGLLAGGTALLNTQTDLGLVASFVLSMIGLGAAEWAIKAIRARARK